jgi:hypothetical protein
VPRPAQRRASQQGASPGPVPEPAYGPRPYDPRPVSGRPPLYGQGPPPGLSGTRAPREPGPRPLYEPDPGDFSGPTNPGGPTDPRNPGDPADPGAFTDLDDPGAFTDLTDRQRPNGPNSPNSPRGHRGRRGLRDPRRQGRPGRIRRLLRRRTVRVILALIAVFCCWVAFSVGQALAAPGGGSVASKLAEWARDHYLGPAVTFGEWLTYQPPKVGGKPSFSLAEPGGSQRFKKVRGFQPIIPKRLSSLAGHALPGEGQWHLLETVRGEPAIWSTFLRPSSVYTSYVAGIVSMDQRLVSFQLHPGAEDPGPGTWGAQPWIPPGSRTGLLATFNGGFKLDSSHGGFYLNGASKGSLVNGAASVVYYRDGTVAIGAWGSEVRMTPNVLGVRQNLKLLIDHGKMAPNLNQSIEGTWGATLGGGYYVWRSGLGITRDHRIIFVYGPALNVQELASLLKRAGAVEALQLDINPEWMSYDYYKADGHPGDPVPSALLPTQQGSAYRYYSIYSRDFTAVYAR